MLNYSPNEKTLHPYFAHVEEKRKRDEKHKDAKNKLSVT